MTKDIERQQDSFDEVLAISQYLAWRETLREADYPEIWSKLNRLEEIENG